MPPTSPLAQDIFAARHARLGRALQAADLEALALNPGPSLVYLAGLHFHLMERPVVVFFTPDRPPQVVLPVLETAKLAALPFATQSFTYSDDPVTWGGAFQKAVQAAQIDGRVIGVEPARLRVLELRFVEAAAPQAKIVSAESCLASLRICKDAAEIAAMRQAVLIAQNALQATLPMIKIGRTEREIANELTIQLLKAGSEPETPFSPIVAGGPNSANPHAVPTDRSLAPGDLLVIDWGATYRGYVSDLTRTFALGQIEPEFAHIAQIVAEANAAGRAAAGPEVAAGEVDQAARAVIEKAGYGPYFTHRTGHGIGMEGHEEPYMRAGNPLPLAAGMAFTVEPGIYLPGRGGVRIEDNMIVTDTGADCLSNLPRTLQVLT
jgi:Xaa-Pro dipeptidase